MGIIIWYRLKCFLKNKTLIFWTLCFPIILGTIFNFVLKDIQNLTPLETIQVMVVDNGNEELKTLVNELSDPKSENYILNVTYVDQNKADQLLYDDEASIVLYLQDKPKIVAKQYGYDTTILKAILSSYTRVYSQIDHLTESDPTVFQRLVIEDLFENNAQINELQSNASDKDMNMIYFYNIISMVCLYGMMWGVAICNDSQATQSKQAARVNVSPLPKGKMLTIDFCLCYCTIVIEILLAIAYLNFALQIPFGENIGLTIGIVLASTLMSLSLGILFGTSKMPYQAKIGSIAGCTVFLGFLAGMMSSSMPYIIKKTLPILTYLNPADLIVRSFTMMYYYSDLAGVMVNIAILSLMGMSCLIISYLQIRRASYASL